MKTRTYKIIFKYKNTEMNFVLTGNDELDVMMKFNDYIEKFKLPINDHTNIYIKEMVNEDE